VSTLSPMPEQVEARIGWLREFAIRVQQDTVRQIDKLRRYGWATEEIRCHLRERAFGLLADARIDIERALTLALGPEPRKARPAVEADDHEIETAA
jgi:hypothetical protein